MVHRALSDETYLSLGLLSPLKTNFLFFFRVAVLLRFLSRDRKCTKSSMSVLLFHGVIPAHDFSVPTTLIWRKNYLSRGFGSSPWFHNDEAKLFAFCHLCMLAYRQETLRSQNLDKANFPNVYYI